MGRRKKRKQGLKFLEDRATAKVTALGHELDLWEVKHGSKSRQSSNRCVKCGGRVVARITNEYPLIEATIFTQECPGEFIPTAPSTSSGTPSRSNTVQSPGRMM